ncbi:LPXTG cell wall anchor domain-containing protein [Staphylococcus sp. GSSP0090]|nr:LPXTG cell wall anchor domain-containing protein [Staphylococcus sp. GSSP0090]
MLQVSTKNQTNPDKLPNTGEDTSNKTFFGVLMAILGSLLLIGRKKRRNE